MKDAILDKYVEKLADHFKIDRDSIFTGHRDRRVCDARNLFVYLSRERRCRYKDILRYMEDNGFIGSEALLPYAYNSARKTIKKDKDYRAIAGRIASGVEA